MPKRIKLQRTRGWRLAEGAVAVTRGRNRRWGNPYRVLQADSRWEVFLCLDGKLSGPTVAYRSTKAEALAAAVDLFRERIMGPHGDLLRARARAELRGRDLACFCALDAPCHADVWLEVANPEGEPDVQP